MYAYNRYQRIIIILIFFILAIFLTDAEGKRAIPDNNLSYPVLVTLKNGIKASGFYLNTEKAIFFVTAGHVLFKGANKVLHSKEAELLSYSPDPEEPTPIVLQLNLEVLNNNGEIKYHSHQDIAVVRITTIIKTLAKGKARTRLGVSIKSMAPLGLVGAAASNIKRFDEVLTANEVFTFGFPTSIGVKNIPQIDYLRPLLRKGIVAGKNKKAQTIIIDCPTYGGNSGGPVLQVEESGFKRHFFIIGLISQFVPFAETWHNKTHGYNNITITNSGYSVVVPMDPVVELISSY